MKFILILSNNYTYEGTIEHNEPHGYGIFNYANGHKYIGYCAFGKPDGFGEYIYNQDTNYIGYSSFGKFHGIGTYQDPNIIIKGHWRNDKKHGYFLKTNKEQCTTFRQLWIKDKLKAEESIQYIQPNALITTKDNPIKRPKIFQVTYKSTEKKCFACGEMPMNATIANCGHVCMCFDCLGKCADKCPICRGPIDRIIRLFVS